MKALGIRSADDHAVGAKRDALAGKRSQDRHATGRVQSVVQGGFDDDGAGRSTQSLRKAIEVFAPAGRELRRPRPTTHTDKSRRRRGRRGPPWPGPAADIGSAGLRDRTGRNVVARIATTGQRGRRHNQCPQGRTARFLRTRIDWHPRLLRSGGRGGGKNFGRRPGRSARAGRRRPCGGGSFPLIWAGQVPELQQP